MAQLVGFGQKQNKIQETGIETSKPREDPISRISQATTNSEFVKRGSKEIEVRKEHTEIKGQVKTREDPY